MDSKITKARKGEHAAGPIGYGYHASPVTTEEKSKEEKDWVVVDSEAKII